MCGRYTLRQTREFLAEWFRLQILLHPHPRYNIAPTQKVPCIRINPHQKEREFTMLKWGLIPSWAKDPRIGNSLINARGETVTEKPAFRGPFRHRRCLVLADGFYEWKPEGQRKQPYFIRFRDDRPFAFAGLWEQWTNAKNATTESCTIITTEPNTILKPIHHRMPVILDPKDFDLWLDPSVQTLEKLRPLFQPPPAEDMEAVPVSLYVNDPGHDGPQCIASLGQ
jgi:putative SOS response-associated peptidase YedK